MSGSISSDDITSAVIERLIKNETRRMQCRAYAEGALAAPAGTEVQDDRIVGHAIRRQFGAEIAGELAEDVNWQAVGWFFRQEAEAAPGPRRSR
jgi:hypothetical protein